MRHRHAQTRPLPAREGRTLRSVHVPPPTYVRSGEGVDPGALADIVAAAGPDVAERAKAALTPLLAHDALVLVTPASPGFPVQIAASRGLREGLAAIAWTRLVESGTVAEGSVARLP